MLDFLFKPRPAAKPTPPTAFDFDKDMNCLFSLIGTYIANEKYKIEIHQKKLLNDDDLIAIANTITVNVVMTISDTYRTHLNKYIAEDRITDFIADVVIKNTVQMGLEINRKIVN